MRSYRRGTTGTTARRFGVVFRQLAGKGRHSETGLAAGHPSRLNEAVAERQSALMTDTRYDTFTPDGRFNEKHDPPANGGSCFSFGKGGKTHEEILDSGGDSGRV